MLNLVGNKKLNAFGLDISERTIKIMQLDRQKNGYLAPKAFGKVDLPPSLINNHLITDEDKLAGLLTKGIKSIKGLKSEYAVVTVPEAKSFVRIVTMPKMELSEVSGALNWELEQDIPVPIDQVYTDWQLVEETPDHLRVLSMSAPKEYIDTLISILRSVKVKPAAFELESASTARAVISREDLSQTVLLIDISSTSTSFAVVSKGILIHTSSIPVGGNTLTENLTQSLGITAKEAEDMKKQFGLLADTKKGNARQTMLSVIDNIIDEIRKVIKYNDEHSFFKLPVSKVILCGGGSRLQGLVDYITARLNVGAGKAVDRVSLCDPWVNLADVANREGFPNSSNDPEYTSAIGLALRAITIDENN